MAVELLIHATTHGKGNKGDIAVVKDSPANWGSNEGPPNYVRLLIPDATKAQVEHYLEAWNLGFNHDVQNLPAGVRRVTVSFDPRITNKFPVKASTVGVAIRNFLIDRYGAFNATFPDGSSLRVDFPAGTNLGHVRDTVTDLFVEKLENRFWRFSESDVDLALASGGEVTLSRSQAIGRILDRR